MAELVASGVAPVKVVYHDGGSHESFVTAMAGVAGSEGFARGRHPHARQVRRCQPSGRPLVRPAGNRPRRDRQAEARVCRRRRSPSRRRPKAAPAPAPQAPAVAAPAPEIEGRVGHPGTRHRNPSNSQSPFYKKMLTGIGDLFGSSSAPQPASASQQVAAPAAASQPRAVATAKPAGPTAAPHEARAGSRTGQPGGRAVESGDRPNQETRLPAGFSCA